MLNRTESHKEGEGVARREPAIGSPEEQEKARQHRRRYKVERLPPRVQMMVFRAYARGVPYEKISARLERRGFHIHRNSLSRYWRNIWHEEHERLVEARAIMAVLKEAFQLGPKSPTRTVAEELLYTMVIEKMGELKQEAVLKLLYEAREQERQGRVQESGKRHKTNSSPARQAREVRRRWRRLYGMDNGEEDDKEGGE
ncbi:MAG: DUF3486 family protein [Acidobacteria bacterium]|nr:DUF3486 family protein [Acidobacteriota bacterium]